MLETLPNWFWIMYYLFLLATLGTAIFSVVKRKMKGFSLITIVFTLTVPIVHILNSIGRAEEMNEFEHLVSKLQQGSIWSNFVIIGYLFLLVWLVIFLFKSKARSKLHKSN